MSASDLITAIAPAATTALNGAAAADDASGFGAMLDTAVAAEITETAAAPVDAVPVSVTPEQPVAEAAPQKTSVSLIAALLDAESPFNEPAIAPQVKTVDVMGETATPAPDATAEAPPVAQADDTAETASPETEVMPASAPVITASLTAAVIVAPTAAAPAPQPTASADDDTTVSEADTTATASANVTATVAAPVPVATPPAAAPVTAPAAPTAAPSDTALAAAAELAAVITAPAQGEAAEAAPAPASAPALSETAKAAASIAAPIAPPSGAGNAATEAKADIAQPTASSDAAVTTQTDAAAPTEAKKAVEPSTIAASTTAPISTTDTAPVVTDTGASTTAEVPRQDAAAPVAQTGTTLSRASIDMTVQIAAQILKKLDGASSRFEMKLLPEELGRVDVKLDIDSDGQLAARLAFDNPAAATEMRGRVDELRRQLEQAGFQISDNALEFAERDSGSHAFDRGHDEPSRARAFSAAARISTDADLAVPAAAYSRLSVNTGLDLRV